MLLEVVGSSVDFDDLYGVTLLGVRHFDLTRSSGSEARIRPRGRHPVLIGAAGDGDRASRPAGLGGPVFFRQWRIGRDGEPVRDPQVPHDGRRRRALRDELRGSTRPDGLFKIADDPRVTAVGRLLRRCSLDELPQLFNVICGRDEPRRPAAARRRRRRADPRPAAWPAAPDAGHDRALADLRFVADPARDMVKLDYLYVSNWTLWGDVKILLRTVPYVLSRRGL